MILVLHAHPYPSHSRACKALLDAVRDIANIRIHSLYDRYPDFDIHVAAEQALLADAQLVVWLHPVYWYGPPSLMKHWMDTVLTHGWAYGPGGTALHGKHCLWVPTMGGTAASYAVGESNLLPFDQYVGPVEQTARYCGMGWEKPHPVFGAHVISDAELATHAAALRERLAHWGSSVIAGAPAEQEASNWSPDEVPHAH